MIEFWHNDRRYCVTFIEDKLFTIKVRVDRSRRQDAHWRRIRRPSEAMMKLAYEARIREQEAS